MKIIGFLKRHCGVIAILVIAITYITYLSGQASNRDDLPLFERGENIVTFNNNIIPTVISNLDNTFYTITSGEVKYIKENGDAIWNIANDFNKPIASHKGEYIAVREEINGKAVVVYNSSGMVYTINAMTDILEASVNENGYVSILRKDNTGYEVYDNTGKVIISRIYTEENRYPISTDVSKDNSLVAVASISTDSLKIKSSISLVSVNDERGVIAGLNLDDGVIVGKVIFTDNDLIIYTDKGIIINETDNYTLLEPIYYNFDNLIEYVEVINNEYLAIVLGAEINNSVYSAGTVLFYDFKGKLISMYENNNSITEVKPAERGIFITAGRNCIYVNVQGRVLWKYSHNRDLLYAMYVGDKAIGLLIENDGIATIEKRR